MTDKKAKQGFSSSSIRNKSRAPSWELSWAVGYAPFKIQKMWENVKDIVSFLDKWKYPQEISWHPTLEGNHSLYDS